MWRGLWFLRKKISPRATPKASFFDTPLPCNFSAGIWKLKILDFVRQTCNYLALSELRDNLRSCIGMIWTGNNCTENKRYTSGYLTSYTYFLTRKRNLLRYAKKCFIFHSIRFICGCQCASLLAIPGAVCNLFIAGDAQAPARAATVTTCDPAAVLSDRTVETNFSACLASASKQINRDYLRLAVCRVAA